MAYNMLMLISMTLALMPDHNGSGKNPENIPVTLTTSVTGASWDISDNIEVITFKLWHDARFDDLGLDARS